MSYDYIEISAEEFENILKRIPLNASPEERILRLKKEKEFFLTNKFQELVELRRIPKGFVKWGQLDTYHVVPLIDNQIRIEYDLIRLNSSKSSNPEIEKPKDVITSDSKNLNKKYIPPYLNFELPEVVLLIYYGLTDLNFNLNIENDEDKIDLTKFIHLFTGVEYNNYEDSHFYRVIKHLSDFENEDTLLKIKPLLVQANLKKAIGKIENQISITQEFKNHDSGQLQSIDLKSLQTEYKPPFINFNAPELVLFIVFALKGLGIESRFNSPMSIIIKFLFLITGIEKKYSNTNHYKFIKTQDTWYKNENLISKLKEIRPLFEGVELVNAIKAVDEEINK